VEHLSAEIIRAELRTEIIGREIHYFPEVDSTNNIGFSLAQEAAVEGTLVIAEKQTSGRGRWGRSWSSPANAGLWFSLILKPALPPQAIARVNLAGAVAVAKAVRKVTALKAYVKWPNDVLVKGKKICGILGESRISRDRIDLFVLGIGINVNMKRELFPEEIRDRATSISAELEEEISRVALLREVLEEFEKLYLSGQEDEFTSVLPEWRLLSSTLNKWVKVTVGGKTFEGYVVDLGENGELVLHLPDDTYINISSGEVELCRE